MTGLATRMLGAVGIGHTSRNPRAHPLVSASSSEMSGWLHKQGYKVSAWSRRYFVLHGALLAYYDDEAAAQQADESRCRGVGYVVDAARWPQGALHKPAQARERRPARLARLPHERCSPSPAPALITGARVRLLDARRVRLPRRHRR